jgi:hypothetical protein
MTGSATNLRDLVESRAAEYGIALRALWGWTLDAIVEDLLVPILPAGVSLDTQFDHGGIPWTWRKVIVSASRSITRHIPENDGWANTLMFSPVAFDRWLTHDSPARTHPVPSPLPVRRRPTKVQVRRAVQTYVESEREKNCRTSIPRMWAFIKNAVPNATRDQAIVELRRIEGGPKRRGRPRKL